MFLVLCQNNNSFYSVLCVYMYISKLLINILYNKLIIIIIIIIIIIVIMSLFSWPKAY